MIVIVEEKEERVASETTNGLYQRREGATRNCLMSADVITTLPRPFRLCTSTPRTTRNSELTITHDSRSSMSTELVAYYHNAWQTPFHLSVMASVNMQLPKTRNVTALAASI